MKVLILLSLLAFSAIQAAEPEVENGMFNAVFNYLKSQAVLLKEEQRQVSIKVLIFRINKVFIHFKKVKIKFERYYKVSQYKRFHQAPQKQVHHRHLDYLIRML